MRGRLPRSVLVLAAAGAAACAAAAAGPALAVAAGEAYVRVDQLGYPSSGAKQAFVIASSPQTGAHFSVRAEGGASVYEGTLGASSGSWSSVFPYVYPVQFGALSAPGRYTIAVSSTPAAISPAFALGTPETLFGPALERTLRFYENERDGPEYVPSALRTAPGHLNDEHAMTYSTPKVNGGGGFKGDLHSLGTTIDAAGGWWDAGDYLKFVQTASYTVEEMLTGVRDFPAAMGASAPAGRDFAGEGRFGVEWLMRMWDDSTQTLYYQVGIGEGNRATAGDHDIWRLPQADDGYGGTDPVYRYIRDRPAFRAGPPGAHVSPNLAGRLAAAFALCAQVFATEDAALAERCLLAGEHVYALADTKPKGHLLTAIPFSFYPEREWRDDLELGASELALALQDGAVPRPAGLPEGNAAFYTASAAGWAAQYIRRHRDGGEGLNLYDVSGVADAELVRAMRTEGQGAGGLAVDETQLLAALRAKLQAAAATAAGDPFSFGFPWAQSDTASHGDGLAVMASEYQWLSGSSTFAADGLGWLGNVLGANAWGVSMIIGDGSVFPDCPSHQVANILGSLDGSPPVLEGAVVEGPTNEPSSGFVEGMRMCPPTGGDTYGHFDGSGAVFEDNQQAYTSTEPAIDLTASSMLAFAWQLQGAPAAFDAAAPDAARRRAHRGRRAAAAG